MYVCVGGRKEGEIQVHVLVVHEKIKWVSSAKKKKVQTLDSFFDLLGRVQHNLSLALLGLMHIHEKSSLQCQKKEGANTGQLFRASGPIQQGTAQSLPSTTGLKMCTYTCTCICTCICGRRIEHFRKEIDKSSQCLSWMGREERERSIYMYMYMERG